MPFHHAPIRRIMRAGIAPASSLCRSMMSDPLGLKRLDDLARFELALPGSNPGVLPLDDRSIIFGNSEEDRTPVNW